LILGQAVGGDLGGGTQEGENMERMGFVCRSYSYSKAIDSPENRRRRLGSTGRVVASVKIINFILYIVG
jgi:hypothetical protein